MIDQMRRRNIIIASVAIVVVAAAVYGIMEYQRTPQKAEDLDAVATISAGDLHAAFIADEAAANSRFVGTAEQAIQVNGVVRSVEEGVPGTKTVILDTNDPMAGVVCDFLAADVPASWKPGMSVDLKGICQGYTGEGMMPGDVILQRCTPLE